MGRRILLETRSITDREKRLLKLGRRALIQKYMRDEAHWEKQGSELMRANRAVRERMFKIERERDNLLKHTTILMDYIVSKITYEVSELMGAIIPDDDDTKSIYCEKARSVIENAFWELTVSLGNTDRLMNIISQPRGNRDYVRCVVLHEFVNRVAGLYCCTLKDGYMPEKTSLGDIFILWEDDVEVIKGRKRE